MSETADRIEPLIAGKYRVIRPLGRGGMSQVLEAEDTRTGKRVALKKLVSAGHLDDANDAKRRVLNEARAASRVHHRNVVDIYDVLEEKDEVVLVMELLRGQSLAERVQSGPIEAEQFVNWVYSALRGAGAAHAAGVIHRDVKPDNVFISEGDDGGPPVAVLIDFGISKVIDADDHGPRTRSGLTMGTPRYVSYEQLCTPKEVDARTDLYAFGVILYEGFTGRTPYPSESLGAQAVSFLTTTPYPVRFLRPQVPEMLACIIDRAIALRREDRHSTAHAFAEALAPYAARTGYTTPLFVHAEFSKCDTQPSSGRLERSDRRATLVSSIEIGVDREGSSSGGPAKPKANRRPELLVLIATLIVAIAAASLFSVNGSPSFTGTKAGVPQATTPGLAFQDPIERRGHAEVANLPLAADGSNHPADPPDAVPEVNQHPVHVSNSSSRPTAAPSIPKRTNTHITSTALATDMVLQASEPNQPEAKELPLQPHYRAGRITLDEF